MKTIAMVGMTAALALGGCAAETGGEEQTGEAEQELPFSITGRAHVGPTKVHASQGGWVEVEFTSLRMDPAGCSKALSGQLVLVLQGPPSHDVRSSPVKPDGKHKLETFASLQAGNYEVAIDPNLGDLELCRWAGDVFVTSH